MLMQLWRPEFELDGINSGSWYHCLPIRIYHWQWEGDCTAVVCKVVCCMVNWTRMLSWIVLDGRSRYGTADDRDRCEWVNVSFGTDSPGVVRDKIHRAIKRLCVVFMHVWVHACMWQIEFHLLGISHLSKLHYRFLHYSFWRQNFWLDRLLSWGSVTLLQTVGRLDSPSP